MRPAASDSLRALRDYLALRWSLDKNSLAFYNSQTLNSSLSSHHHNSLSHQSHSTHPHHSQASDKPVTEVPKSNNTASSEIKATTEKNVSKENSSSRENEVAVMDIAEKLCDQEERSVGRDSWRECVKGSQLELDSTYNELLVEVRKYMYI